MAASTVSSVFRPGLFAGKRAIVTGGGTGIGLAITQELLYLGCDVMIASRKAKRLATAVDEIQDQLKSVGNTARVDFIQCNIRKEEDVSNLMRTTIEKFGGIDYLVNNGGGQFMAGAEHISLKGFNAVVETNLTGTFLCCREAYNAWMADHGGVIVNMIANMFNGWPGTCPSGAARAGVDNLTKTLSIEWAPSGVRINAVAPGSSIFSQTAAANYGAGKDIFDVQIPRIPAKRLGTTEEVSATVCFLLSPAASFISGETVRIDGAQSLYSTSSFWEIPDHNKIAAFTWKADSDDSTSRNKSKL